jgi:PAS domain-containing protein
MSRDSGRRGARAGLLAEAAAANAKFRAFFEQGALFAGIIDLDGTTVEMNRLLGRQRLHEEAGGGTASVGRPVVDAVAAAGRADQVRVRRSEGRSHLSRELPYFVADGSEREVDCASFRSRTTPAGSCSWP